MQLKDRKCHIKKRNFEITSSQIEVSSSGDLVLALAKSMIESKGFGCNGVNPDANLEFLTEPSEAHFMWFPGKPSESLLETSRCKEDEHAVKICLDEDEEEDDEENLSLARLEIEPTTILLIFMVGIR